MKRALLSLLLLCLPVMVLAQSVRHASIGASGNDYLRMCEAAAHGQTTDVHGETTDEALQCVVWMHGVLQGFKAYQAVSHSQLFEVPPEVETGQIEKIVVKYMNDNPKRLDQPTSLLVLHALMDAYPANKK